jgi:hypothetical protein
MNPEQSQEQRWVICKGVLKPFRCFVWVVLRLGDGYYARSWDTASEAITVAWF